MEILTQKENDILKIHVIGRLDASNAPQLEMKVYDDLSSVKEVIIDAAGLEYISSAGLRVILKIKHEVDNTSIINANAEVYDIFEMTGFSEMMPVSKKFREISVENCEIIGQGYCGTVYRISKDTIVKVYRADIDLEGINREREMARKAFVLGIPTAIPYDVVKVGDKYGSVFELLEAETLQKRILKNPDQLDAYIAQYVKVLKIIHSSEVNPGELAPKKQEMLERTENVVKLLDKKTGDKLTKLIKGVKDTNTIIHGDYHVKNIMVQNNEPFIIDMDTLSVGSPIFELGFMYSCYEAYQEINKLNGEEFFGIKQDILDKIYWDTLRLYFEGKPESYIQEIHKKARVASYVQLIDRFTNYHDHPEEVKLFVKEITELVGELKDLNL